MDRDEPTPTYIDELVAVLKRANPKASVDRDALRNDLLDLMSAVGAGQSQAEKDFRSFDSRVPHKKLALAFERIARSATPLEHRQCRGDVFAELDRYLRWRWTSRARRRTIVHHAGLRGLTSADLTPPELAEVRSAACHLAGAHAREVQRKQPPKGDQDALVSTLALIFVQFAGLDTNHHDLPHSVRSHFIQFCQLAVRPFFSQTELSEGAIAKRWHRLKMQAKPDTRRRAGRPTCR